MTESPQINNLLRLLENAEASLSAARELLGQINPNLLATATTPQGSSAVNGTSATAYNEEDRQVIEGIFDGQNMVGPNEKLYPVPANYASKSKLVEGDRLKLTIMPNGTMLYKQIAPIARDHLKGTLISEDGQYKVLANNRKYRVLLASVTYYKAQMGDEVILLVPNGIESNWGTLEAVIPQFGEAQANTEDHF